MRITNIEVLDTIRGLEMDAERVLRRRNYGVFSKDYEINFLIDEVREVRDMVDDNTDMKVDRLDIVLEKLQDKVKEGIDFSLEQLEIMMEDRLVDEMPRIMKDLKGITSRIQGYMNNKDETEYLERADELYEEAEKIMKGGV